MCTNKIKKGKSRYREVRIETKKKKEKEKELGRYILFYLHEKKDTRHQSLSHTIPDIEDMSECEKKDKTNKTD